LKHWSCFASLAGKLSFTFISKSLLSVSSPEEKKNKSELITTIARIVKSESERKENVANCGPSAARH